MIAPHGGALVDLALPVQERPRARAAAERLRRVVLDARALADLVCLATGIYSPLRGFMTEDAYRSVVTTLRLPNGPAWTIPIVLALDDAVAAACRLDDELALTTAGGAILATLRVASLYRPDREAEARAVFGTSDRAHPGASVVLGRGATYAGGPVTLIADLPPSPFRRYELAPVRTRAIFAERGWRTVVGFQTRNPIHRAHEYLTKVALELVDGLFINPIVGETKPDDIPADVRVRCYEALLDGYYRAERTVFGIFPAAMRYGGPREAILHAIARLNYGCTHFIVGRDHAGVGRYYDPYAAQRIFEEFTRDELAIEPLRFENAYWSRRAGGMVTDKTAPPAGEDDAIALSGTTLRAMLAQGEMPPPEVTRPEVARILVDALDQTRPRPLGRGEPPPHLGCTVWFTGLSGAGKSTIAGLVERELLARGVKVEVLDGDIVRTNLSKGLGFTKEDRDTNVRRIAFVAELLARNGVVAITAAISPYRAIREEARARNERFVEVFVDAPLEICEARDVKGLYARARRGEIPQFTGIDDAYEPPEHPEVVCRTADETVDESAGKVLAYLEKIGVAPPRAEASPLFRPPPERYGIA
jgi:sulfate adenylyltransferase